MYTFSGYVLQQFPCDEDDCVFGKRSRASDDFERPSRISYAENNTTSDVHLLEHSSPVGHSAPADTFTKGSG